MMRYEIRGKGEIEGESDAKRVRETYHVVLKWLKFAATKCTTPKQNNALMGSFEVSTSERLGEYHRFVDKAFWRLSQLHWTKNDISISVTIRNQLRSQWATARRQEGLGKKKWCNMGDVCDAWVVMLRQKIQEDVLKKKRERERVLRTLWAAKPSGSRTRNTRCAASVDWASWIWHQPVFCAWGVEKRLRKGRWCSAYSDRSCQHSHTWVNWNR